MTQPFDLSRVTLLSLVAHYGTISPWSGAQAIVVAHARQRGHATAAEQSTFRTC